MFPILSAAHGRGPKQPLLAAALQCPALIAWFTIATLHEHVRPALLFIPLFLTALIAWGWGYHYLGRPARYYPAFTLGLLLNLLPPVHPVVMVIVGAVLAVDAWYLASLHNR